MAGGAQPAADTIAEILCLCQADPSLADIARQRLDELIARFDVRPDVSAPKGRAQHEIDMFLCHLRRHREVKPTALNFRDFARCAARRYNLPLDQKVTKRQDDVIQWLDEHWDKVRRDLFTYLEQGIQ
jgi:hypothetical protein